MTLSERLRGMLDQPGSMHRLPGGLGLAYSRADGFHILALSRIAPKWPSQQEEQVIRDALSALQMPAHLISRTSEQVGTSNVIRLCWPIGQQMTLFD